jgi:hypothetical protein
VIFIDLSSFFTMIRYYYFQIIHMAVTIIGMFQNQKDSENAISRLKDLGYDPKDISIVMKEVKQAREVAQDTGVNIGEGAAAGATTGGVIGAIAGLLVGIGAITVPGLGPLLVGGPIASALGLTGAAATTTTGAVGGLLAGGLLGALAGLGIPKEEAARYEEKIKAGGILLAVASRDLRKDEIREVMGKYNATDIRQLDLRSSPIQTE